MIQKPDQLSPFNSVHRVHIAWGDMDAAQHVNNAMYLRYLESARIQYLSDIDFGYDQNGIGVILAEVNLQYRIPLTFPDIAWIGTRPLLDTLDDNSMWTEQIIVSERYQKIANICKARLVCYDYRTLAKAKWPPEVLEKIVNFEK